MRRLAALLALLVGMGSRQVDAQTGVGAPLDSGQIVRVDLRDGRRLTGRLTQALGAGDRTVAFCRHPAVVCGAGTVNPVRTESLADVGSILVPHGNRAGRGALIGGILGGVLGAMAWTVGSAVDEGEGSPEAALVLVPAVGAGIGALFGSFSEQWAPP